MGNITAHSEEVKGQLCSTAKENSLVIIIMIIIIIIIIIIIKEASVPLRLNFAVRHEPEPVQSSLHPHTSFPKLHVNDNIPLFVLLMSHFVLHHVYKCLIYFRPAKSPAL
jgi:uncharacterized membrane protein